MKVLIIEDHYRYMKRAINAVVFKDDEAGEDTNVLVTATADPFIAEELLRKPWDWILIDHDLPNRMSGWQLLNNTSSFRNKGKKNIIAISAVPGNNRRLEQHGASYSIAKMDGNFEEEIRKIIFPDE